MTYQEILDKLSKEQLFLDWEVHHPAKFLSHFFAQINGKIALISPWEIGFYDTITKKITIFTEYENNFIIKPADDVFKKESDEVEQLKLEDIKISLDQAKKNCLKALPEKFPSEAFGDGFLILQCWKENIVWNFTFITKSLKFVNLKISANNGEVIEHQAVELVQK